MIAVVTGCTSISSPELAQIKIERVDVPRVYLRYVMGIHRALINAAHLSVLSLLSSPFHSYRFGAITISDGITT